MAATRRLAAIMFTDIVGYTALTQANEEGALKLLREQEELVRPLFAVHHGREIKSTGDGSLVEFESALRAVQCATDIQQHLQERNSQRGVTPIQLRIGIHLGDVEERGNDIFGDAVNIASRIQPLAPPGGVCISGEVHSQVRNKIPNEFDKLEPQALKNVLLPVDIYRVVLPSTIKTTPSVSAGPTRLAVLPFANISPDPHDEYFADGLTEEMITVLSHLRELRVIARTSVTPYKSTSKGVLQIGNELGVSSILEGSVRRAGNHLRVTVQLIDVATQGHVWANTYDRELNDVLAIQTEIAKRVAKQLKISVRAAEETRLEARVPIRPDSYLAYLKGRSLLHGLGQASIEAAKSQFELAITLDSKNAAAYSGLADATHYMVAFRTEVPQAKLDETARRMVARAIELEPNLAEAHASLANLLWDDFEYKAAEKEFKLALSLNPSYSQAHFWYACVLADEGRADESLLHLMLAEGTDPLWPALLAHCAWWFTWRGDLDQALDRIHKLGKADPDGGWYHMALAIYNLARSDLEGCLKEIHRNEEVHPDAGAKPILRALSCALSGEKEQARALLRNEETLGEFGGMNSFVIWAYCELGDLDACFRWLERAVKSHQISFQAIRLNPRLEPIRNDPRFPALLKMMNLA